MLCIGVLDAGRDEGAWWGLAYSVQHRSCQVSTHRPIYQSYCTVQYRKHFILYNKTPLPSARSLMLVEASFVDPGILERFNSGPILFSETGSEFRNRIHPFWRLKMGLFWLRRLRGACRDLCCGPGSGRVHILLGAHELWARRTMCKRVFFVKS